MHMWWQTLKKLTGSYSYTGSEVYSLKEYKAYIKRNSWKYILLILQVVRDYIRSNCTTRYASTQATSAV